MTAFVEEVRLVGGQELRTIDGGNAVSAGAAVLDQRRVDGAVAEVKTVHGLGVARRGKQRDGDEAQGSNHLCRASEY